MQPKMLTEMLDCWWAFLLGLLIWPLVQFTLSRTTSTRKSSLYGLEHGILNLKLPSSTFWMNLGHWKRQMDAGDPKDLPQACQDLLIKILSSAFPQDKIRQPARKICLLDVGFGCGDQTIFILSGYHHEKEKDPKTQGLPEIAKYVGITNDPMQYSFALERLESRALLHQLSGASDQTTAAEIYLANAARPTVWSQGLKLDAAKLSQTEGKAPLPETWLLGLDTLHHFAPSRLQLLLYAREELAASLMAFDLFLADGDRAPNIAQRLFLRFFCMLFSTPYTNLLTPNQYREMLKMAGYETVEIEDISEYVFDPLARFLERQNTCLNMIGHSLGRFQIASLVFGWWARSGIIRGCVVVARK